MQNYKTYLKNSHFGVEKFNFSLGLSFNFFWNLHLVKNGYRYRDFLALPIGGRRVVIRMKVQRYKCKHKGCDYDRQEKIPFATGSQTYTHRFAKYVVDLLRAMTLNIGIRASVFL
nr:transposase family protein [Prevotella disiens]